jgi:phosphoglycolate phosphatase
MARIVFDLDGTLVDSLPTITAAGNAMLARIGRGPVPPERVAGFVGHGMARLVERLLAATGGLPPEGAAPHLAAYRAIYAADPLTGTAPYPGVAASLAALDASGHGLAVCTQKPVAPARDLLAGLGLMPPIAGLTGGDSLPVLKPDPRLLHHAADQLPAGPVVLVGDSETDAATAAAAGVPFVLHLAGYRHGSLAAIPRAAEFDDFAELPALLAGLLGDGPAA